MKLRSLAMTVAGLVIFAASSLAQIWTLEGNVIGTDGKPVVGAVVKIHRTDVKWDAQTKTDKRGHYIHSGVPYGGIFDVSIVINGENAATQKGVHSAMGDHPPTDFDLRKTVNTSNPATQALIQKAVETGQIPDELKRQMTPEQQEALKSQMAESKGKIQKQTALNASFNEGVTALQAANAPGAAADVKAQQYQAAVTALEKAGEIDPKQPAVWANLGDAYLGLASTKTGADFDQATAKGIDAYNKSLELKPDDPATHNNYALALAKAKKYPEAEAELRKAAELDPPSAYLRFYNLGALLSNVGQAEPASKAFKAAIDSAPDNPKNAPAYYQYGLSLAGQATVDEKTGKFTFPPGTLEAFQKYLELTPSGPDAQACKDMIAQLGGSVQTTFTNPNAAKKKK
jgi:tetratricopeptide (TPR) repeat protein